MSREKSMIQMLAACEKSEFDKIVKTYLREIYSYHNVVQTDGKDDCGLDIRVFDSSGQKIQYQITIQKSETNQEKAKFEKKVFADVAKAKENVECYGYANQLMFFYSYQLTNRMMLNYQAKALKDYGIFLTFIDAKQIATAAEDMSIKLQEEIYNTSGLAEFKLKKSLYDDENNNLIYDLVSFGQSVDIKLEIVEAYIQRCIYERGCLTVQQISNLCLQKFSTSDNPDFYEKLIRNLYSRKKKLSYDKIKKTYSLTDETYEEITRRSEQIKLDEKQFIRQIGAILSSCNQDKNIDDYVNYLRDIYIESFNKRIEVQNSIDNINKIESLNKFISYTKENVKDETTRKDLVQKLIETCDSNKYLQKICASFLFSQKVNINNLQKYAKERKQVYIDTTIALYILCYFNNPSSNFCNYNYQLSRSLCDFCKKNDIKLYLTNRYLWEVGTHIQEAFNLLPFTKLPNFSSLGKSRNVFFNHYNYLFDSEEIDMSYEEYLYNYNFVNSNSNRNCQLAEQFLKNMGVLCIQLPKYDIQSEVKIIGTELSLRNRYKTNFALNNDAIMLKYLADNDVKIHPIDPVFVTWDKTLFGVLETFYKENPMAHRWMQFTPSQFIDRYSLLSFSINEETISKDILALLSGDIVQHTTSLIDSLALILNPNDEIGLEYTKKFAEMKDSQIYMTSKVPDTLQENPDNDGIDYIISKIVSHYRENSDDYNSFKNLFTSKEYMENVINIFSDALQYYRIHREFDTSIIGRFDQLIKSMRA